MRVKTTLLIIYTVMLTLVIPTNTPADTLGVEATSIKQLHTGKPPLDVVTSTDGKLMFVLIPGEVLIYSNLGDIPVNRIRVNKSYTRMTLAEKLDLLILSSNSNQIVDMVRIDMISDISIDGSPYLGREDAAVTIAVFDDYQ